MDDISKDLADVVEKPDLAHIVDDSNEVDHAQVIEELNSFTRNNPDIKNTVSEQLQHGLVLPAIFVGIAVVQFTLACVVFASLIYFIIRDYWSLQRGRRLQPGNVRILPGEDQGGDNHANDNEDDDDDDNLEAAGLPPAAPEGTPPSQFPNDIVRRRTAAAPAVPPPPPPPAPPAGTPRGPLAVVQVSSRPMTLTVVDRSLATAAATAAATASTADGGRMDDGTDIASRLQTGGVGAKPKKPRQTRKYQLVYRPRTAESNSDETSIPTATDDNDVVSVTSATDSERRQPADVTTDVTSARETTDSDVNAAPAAGAATSWSWTVDDDYNTADEADSEWTGGVPARSTRPSAHLTLDDPAISRPSRRPGLFDQPTLTAATDASQPTSSAGLRSPSFTTPQTDNHHHRPLMVPQRQQPVWQHGGVACENGVCRLRMVTSNKHCHELRPFAAPPASMDVASTTVRDAKSESTASEAATTTSHRATMPPVTADAHSGSRVTSTGSPSVDVTEQSSGSADDHEATSQRALPPSVADDELLGRVDAAVTEQSAGVDTAPPSSDTADQTTTSTSDNLLPPPTTVDHVPDDYVAGQEADEAAALTAAAEALVRQSTAAVAPLILASNVEDVEKHHLL